MIIVFFLCLFLPSVYQLSKSVSRLTEEKSRLDTELQDTRLELGSVKQSRKQIEEENGRLLQRLAAFEDQQVWDVIWYMYTASPKFSCKALIRLLTQSPYHPSPQGATLVTSPTENYL